MIELLDGAVEIIFPDDEEGCFDQGTSDQEVPLQCNGDLGNLEGKEGGGGRGEDVTVD